MGIGLRETQPDARTRSRARGAAGTLIAGGIIDDVDQNTDLRGDRWYGSPGKIGIAEKMLRDAHVKMSLDAIGGPLRAASWGFEPSSKSAIDIEVAKFCEWAFFECIGWDQALRNILKYKYAGFSLVEMTDDAAKVPVDRFPLHPGGGAGVCVTGLHHRPAWSVYGWEQSKANPLQMEAFTQWVIGSDAERSGFRKVPASRTLRFTENQDGANFAGLSTLRSAYGPWKIKHILMIVEGIKHERQGAGIPSIKLPEGATDEDIDTAQTILAEMRAHEKGFLILPHGYEFEWQTTSSGDGTAISEAIERCNRDIAFNVAAGFMLLGLTGKTGSFALANSQQGQFEIGLESDARFIAEVFNRGADGWSPVERIVRMNYGEEVGLPRMIARNMPTRDWSKVLPVVHNLAMSRNLTPDDRTEAFIRDVLRMPQREPETARATTQIAVQEMTDDENTNNGGDNA